MEKMKFETVDGTRRNIDKIAEMFPQVVTEVLGDDGKLKRAVKWDTLKELLSGDYVEGGECYEFTWPGKRAAIAEAAKPIRKTLRPCKEESKNWDTTENLYIEGDNLEVLKLLQESYLGKVKMIYIDPPYNTGNDFVYKDNFTKDKDTSEEELGLFDEETDNRTMSGELFHNTESNGRFHSDWCSMMYPRLQIAKDLLADDGVIFISADEHEIHNLRKLCDEIFGSNNFLVNLVWEKRYTRSNNAKKFTTLTEPILCYAKNSIGISTIKEPRNEKADSIYSNPDNDPRGVWTSVSYVNPATRDERPNLTYSLYNPILQREVNHPTNAWKYEKSTYEQHVRENKLYWGKNGENTYPRLKKFLFEMDGGMVPVDLWGHKDSGSTDQASKELEDLLGRKIFDFPKPKELIQRMLSLIVNENNDSDFIFIDFFSGSATSAHAVMKLNAEDGGKRKFIMVQLPEVCEEKSEAAKAGYKNICEIGKERIRRAGEKILAECAARTNGGGNGDGSGDCSRLPDLDIGFRVFKVADSNMKDVYYSAGEYSQDMLDSLVSNIKEDRTDLDLLYGCLLEWGVELSLPHTSETIDNVTVHTVNNGDLIACFDANIPESAIRTIAKRQPLRAVFRDSSFASAPQKINVEEIFKLLSPTTTVKVI